MAGDRNARRNRQPAWYPDPDRPDRLRYWDGAAWTTRRRPFPRWSAESPNVIGLAGSNALEGPVRAAELPAPAAGVGTTRQASPGSPNPGDAGSGMSSTTDAPMPIRRTSDDGPPPGGPGDPTGGGGGGGGEGGKEPDSTRRRRWIFFAAVAVLAAGAVWIAGAALVPKSYGPRVLHDATFIRLANAQCTAKLADLRPPDAGPFGTTITPTQAADSTDKAATGMDNLAIALRSLPASAADRPFINSWLDGWNRYAALGRQYATFLRQNGTATPSRQLRDSIVHEASVADNFVLANGLKACEFTVAPNQDPSNGF
jgi:Protein of unknown function (DUF2510)